MSVNVCMYVLCTSITCNCYPCVLAVCVNSACTCISCDYTFNNKEEGERERRRRVKEWGRERGGG